ncbi:hypothetical protein NLX83_17915 [Allokutzneria sp. A3M-2-11 16]|uniref:hypothetical protein n=1 Tax=Allokutzneria sp. A3M-2-11 16 TaxID=2962043 RepID=UPI0020B79952|nr:hypothetical protein [Allokutzneria sp. A3M-2-11 16]MCP3801140.1 hypothetical protein [Allokutzneria sp. A3M-2-11 16]
MNRSPKIGGGVLAGLLLIGMGSAIGKQDQEPVAAPVTSVTTYTQTQTQYVTVTPTTTQTPAPATEEPAPQKTWSPGTYKVGEDIDPGTYVSDGGSTMCYWARMRNDSEELGSIIANDISQGKSRFTTKKGEYVKISGCTFAKQ